MAVTRLDDSQIGSTKLENLVQNVGHIKAPVSSESDLPVLGVVDGEQILVKGSNKMMVFDSNQNKWVDLSGASTPGASIANQTTKLGVAASQGTPYNVDVAIAATIDFKRVGIEVLKFIPGTQNQLVTECNFNNSDSSNFTADSQVVFDGKMHLKTTYQSNMIDEGIFGDGKLFSMEIDKTIYSVVESISVL